MATQDSNPQAGAGRPLPKKEADLFKNVVKHYETKQYKKAVKQADTILKKFPNHGETLAMKGLTLSHMSKKEEAHSLVKEGLRNDMRSHVCWHVYGLLHRADRNYNEAIKAYKQALRIEPENLQILRDLSMLQIQMRDLDGFAVTRNTLLSLKPNAKINWMAFALSRHLTGDLREALKVVDAYLGTLTEGSSDRGRGFESGELAMYQNSIMSEIPDNYADALKHLLVCEGLVVDRGAWLMKKAEYELKLKDFQASRESTLSMFQRGMTESHSVHSLYMCAVLQLEGDICDEALRLTGTQTLATMLPLTEEQTTALRIAYDDLKEKFPRSHAIQRIPLTMLDGDELRKGMDARCRKDLTKGVPSLCSELRSYLWTDKGGRFIRTTDPADVREHPKFVLFVKMVDEYVTNLVKSSKFDESDEGEESPSTLLWAWFLRAGLHELAGEYLEGIGLLDKCLEHTPTAVDVYELKARLLKAAGNVDAAVECLDKGRDLDRQDRYINNQTTKYMLQAGKAEEALSRISLFTRHEGNPEQNLYDMQCSWYELELAACLARKEEWGRSLKKFSAVVKHFDDFHEDQFDFHSYCLRKVTLRSYVSVLRFEDKLFGQDYYCSAASGIIRIYLHLFDNPSTNETQEPDYSSMNAAERKRAKAIARKKKKATEKKEADVKEKETENGGKGKNTKGGKPSIVDEDPFGKELLKLNPLDEAKKYSAVLARYAPESLETWTLQYDVAIRRTKALMALQALYKARSIDARSSDLFSRTVDFASKVDSFKDVSSPVRQVLADKTQELLGNLPVGDFVKQAADSLAKDAKTDLPMRTAVAKALVDMKLSPIAESAAVITSGGMLSRKVNIQTCLEALEALKSFGEDAAAATTQWTAAVKERFPTAL